MEHQVLFRIYTRSPLTQYGRAAAQVIEGLAPALLASGEPAYLRVNPFADPADRPLSADALAAFLRDLAGGGVESFALFARDPGAPPERAFPFLVRVDGVAPGDIYYQHKLHHELGVARPEAIGGHCIEVAVAAGEGGAAVEDLLGHARALFVASDGLYGYLTAGSPAESFQRLSGLEIGLGLFRTLKDGPWIDHYQRRVAGVFWANLLGPSLARAVQPSPPPGSEWHAERLAGGGLLVRSLRPLECPDGDPSAAHPGLAALLPTTPAPPRPLPEAQRVAVLFDGSQVRRLGGPAFLKSFLPADEVATFEGGWALVTREIRDEFDDHVLNHFFWPLRPSRCALWEIRLPRWQATYVKRPSNMDDTIRVSLRARVTEADLHDSDGVPLRLSLGGRSRKELRQAVAAAVQDWARRSGGDAARMTPDKSGVEGRVRLARLDVPMLIDALEAVRVVTDQLPFLLSLGAADAHETRLLQSMLAPDAVYLNL